MVLPKCLDVLSLQPSKLVWFLAPLCFFLMGCNAQKTGIPDTVSLRYCEQLKASCQAECAGAATCEVDCNDACVQAIHTQHCKYDDSTFECDAVDCPDNKDCTWVGSSQPTYNNCLAFCAANLPDSQLPEQPQDSLLLLLCAQHGEARCGGGTLDDQKQCTYDADTGKCYSISCEECPDGSLCNCRNESSDQPSLKSCLAWCAEPDPVAHLFESVPGELEMPSSSAQ